MYSCFKKWFSWNTLFSDKSKHILAFILGQEPSAAKTGSGLGIAPQQKAQQEQLKIIEPVVPKEPPPEFEFIADPPSISAFDL